MSIYSFIQLFQFLSGELIKDINNPHLISLINTIKKIRSDIDFSNWDAARKQRNFLAHEYPALFIQNLDTCMTDKRNVGKTGLQVMQLGDKELVIRFAAHETSILWY